MSNPKTKRIEYVLEFHPPPGARPSVRDEIIQYKANTPFHPIHVGDYVSPFTLKFDNEDPHQLEKELGPLEVGASSILVDRIEHHILENDDSIWDAVWIFTKRVLK